MNKYRVDRIKHDAKMVPCGMNSIVYIGDSLSKAKAAYFNTSPGFDVWGNPNPEYSVSLSVWEERKDDYQFLATKDL